VKRFYLLGRRIAHSLSPPTWNRVFARLGADARYGLFDVDSGGLDDALKQLYDDDVIGYNVTMPHQAWAARQAEIHGFDVARAGTASWIRVRDGRIGVANTDIEGARVLLDAIPRSDRVLLLGAGGTASAVLVALEGRAGQVGVANRTAESATRLVARAAGWLPDVVAVPWNERMREAARADLIINTTSLGMCDEVSPLDRPLPGYRGRIYDVVYRAGPTPLQRQAAAWGVPFTDGLAHLEAQAVALIPHFGLAPHDADLVRESVRVAAGRWPHVWEVPAADRRASAEGRTSGVESGVEDARRRH
jgi:shikimate dehydrogenase